MFQDDDVIDLRGDSAEAGDSDFKIHHFDEPEGESAGSSEGVAVDGGALSGVANKPHDKVKIKFDKFVNLVATHAYEEVFEKHEDEDIIISTDLLADLANAHEEKGDRKVPAVFLFGILLGLALAWLLLK
jgi:hypothetical protein